ncbi:MAG: helix-turn-helix transcriptional regulator [Myxococcota bacterium]
MDHENKGLPPTPSRVDGDAATQTSGETTETHAPEERLGLQSQEETGFSVETASSRVDAVEPGLGSEPVADVKKSASSPEKSKQGKRPNNVRRIRIERMMSKAELARRANLSVLTIDRVEKGYGCRMNTKRKILEALGLSLAERVRVFGEEE